MRNTLILVDEIHHDQTAGLKDYDAIVESTVRRARPVILTAAAAMLAFIPLTHSVFWGALAYVLIGGVGVGTLLTLLFLPRSTPSGSGSVGRRKPRPPATAARSGQWRAVGIQMRPSLRHGAGP